MADYEREIMQHEFQPMKDSPNSCAVSLCHRSIYDQCHVFRVKPESTNGDSTSEIEARPDANGYHEFRPHALNRHKCHIYNCESPDDRRAPCHTLPTHPDADECTHCNGVGANYVVCPQCVGSGRQASEQEASVEAFR